MQREHSLAESLAENMVRGAISGAVASLTVIPLASLLVRRLGPQRVAPAARLEEKLTRTLGLKSRASLLGDESGVSPRRLLLGVLWGAAYGAIHSSGEISTAAAGPLFGCALGTLDIWLTPPNLRVFPASNGRSYLPWLARMGLNILFGTVVGQIFEANRPPEPASGIHVGIASFKETNPGLAQPAERHDPALPVSDSTVRPAAKPTPRVLRRADLAGRLVFARDDHALGKVKGVTDNCVEIATPIADLGPTLYVPFEAFDYCTAAGCYLRQSLAEISASDWNHVPGAEFATESEPSRPGDAASEEEGPTEKALERLVEFEIPFIATGQYTR